MSIINYFVPLQSENKTYIAEWQQLVARQAHNLEVIGSNPISATPTLGDAGMTICRPASLFFVQLCLIFIVEYTRTAGSRIPIGRG